MTEKKFKFKRIDIQPTIPSSPESLFRDLRGRSPEIKNLWSHQADLLRNYYEKHLNTKDISLELPTGSGKTLVGLLIGEFRRLANNERVVYLCPTRQLANQVHMLASEYDIKTYTFVGKQSEYPTNEFSGYLRGKAIAISTYSGIFNINPKIKDPNVIIFDDAHSAENYIASMWSLKINRFDHKDLFLKIVSIFEDKLTMDFVNMIKANNRGSTWRRTIELIPSPSFWDQQDTLNELLEENIKDYKELYYPWTKIREHLAACNLFISWSNILIRPWIPPSLSHSPFESANQRVYMSATLGAGGELERIIGVRRIERLRIPPGWERQGSGRRFFVFPDYSFKQKEYSSWLANQIRSQDRTLILCPDGNSIDEIKNIITDSGVDQKVLTSHDIEQSLESFTSDKNVSLILANRYDGLDLPDKACRQLIIFGLPGGTNIQERFLLDRLGLSSLLKDRIRTRFTQASGRTTRGATDYSLVIPVKKQLFSFCLKTENQEGMHPELHAELSFGIEQSEVSKLDELTELIKLFFERGPDWENVEENIKELRGQIEIKRDERSEIFRSVVKYEVDYMYYLWSGNYKNALESARHIVDQLSEGELSDYMALWNYFTGCLGWKLKKKDIAKKFFKGAIDCSKTVTWYSGLAEILNTLGETSEKIDLITGYAIENIQQKLSDLRSTGSYFEQRMNEIQDNINSNEASKFEFGLKELGELMGFLTEHPKGTAAPDSVWRLSDRIIILFEAKSGEAEEHGISVGTCRQASGHYDWAKGNINLFDNFEKKVCVVTSPRKYLDKSAKPFASNLYYMDINKIRNTFVEISGILRRIRSQTVSSNDEEIRSKILNELKENSLDPKGFIEQIEGQKLIELPQK